MTRIAITKNGEPQGTWFNPDAAILKVKEETYHDGSNWISKATNSQWEHEALYYTKSGRFVLNHWSQWQGSRETYEEITAEDAAFWIIQNEFSDLDFLEQLPEKVKHAVLATIDKAEI